MERLFSKLFVTVLLVFALAPITRAETPMSEAAKALPDQIGNFRAQGEILEPSTPPNASVELQTALKATRQYRGPAGSTYQVFVYVTDSDSEAFSLLTTTAALNQAMQFGKIGTANTATSQRLDFFKGRTFVTITSADKAENLNELARGLAEKLAAGDNDLPVLVKHLPNWETARERARYVTSLRTLKSMFEEQVVLEAVSFEAGAEAVTASYGDPDKSIGNLVIIEFTTPQLATDNDRYITAKINELKGLNHPVGSQTTPTAYRRVGNYAVFVFNGADEQAANKLIDEVKYEQVTQWLGTNPYPLLDAQRKYVATTLGVLVSVVKSTGIAIVVCLSVGGIFGALLFRKRRSQQRAVDAYSDAGGMLRLNLDDLTTETDPARLIGPTN